MINDDQKTTSLDLAQIREDIDSVDQQIQQLINRRAKLAESVAKANNLQQKRIRYFIVLNVKHRFYVKLWSAMRGHCQIKPWHVYSVKLCLHVWHLKHPQSIAFLGPVGTYTHSAVLKHFGQDAVVRSITNDR